MTPDMLDKCLKITKIVLAVVCIAVLLLGAYWFYNKNIATSSTVGSGVAVTDQVGWLIGMVTVFLTAFGVISVLFFAVIVAMVWDNTKAHQESREITREMKVMKEQARKFVEEEAPKLVSEMAGYAQIARRNLVEQITVKQKAERLDRKGKKIADHANN